MTAETLSERGLRQALYQVVIAKARRLVQDSGLNSPPFLPEVLVRGRQIRIERRPLGSVSALLIPLKDGFTVKINTYHSRERQNFSCAHEIAHTFFLESDAGQLANDLRASMGLMKYSAYEETLCHLGASELLMPYYIFMEYASRYDFGVEAISPMARQFQTSITATAIRLGQVSPRPCAVLFWGVDKDSDLGKERLRVRWATSIKARASQRQSCFVSLKMLRDKASSIFEAFKSDAPICADELLNFGNFKARCQIQSQGFGNGAYRYVVSLAFPEQPKD